MRILIRKQENELYLQPSGEWSEAREAAREFKSSCVAYLWALEQKLLGIEILLAFDDPRYDLSPMKL